MPPSCTPARSCGACRRSSRSLTASATKIHVDDRLAEDQPFEGALDLLGDVEDGAVLCSHGDVIPATINALVRRGMEVQTPVDWRKGTVWVLKRKGDRITKGKVWPPPT